MDTSEEDNNYSEEVVIINDPVTEASHPNNLMESDSESNLADDELSLVSSDYDVNEIAISTPPDMVVDGVEAPGEQERGIAQVSSILVVQSGSVNYGNYFKFVCLTIDD